MNQVDDNLELNIRNDDYNRMYEYGLSFLKSKKYASAKVIFEKCLNE